MVCTTGLLAGDAGTGSSGAGSRFAGPLPKHEAQALGWIADRTGVYPEAWRSFFASLQRSAVQAAPSGVPFSAAELLADFEDTTEARSRLLETLARHGGLVALNEDLHAEIYRARLYRIRFGRHAETHRTVALFSFIEDLIREKVRVVDGRPSQWYHHAERRFVSFPEQRLPVRRPRKRLPGQRVMREPFAQHFSQFPFEPGDIVLSVGGSSASALIPLATMPQRRHSHAFLVARDRRGRLRVMESVIEKGVIGCDEFDFRSKEFHGMVVLRMRRDLPGLDAGRRAEILRTVVRLADAQVKRRAPYNMSMDMSRDADLGFFCSQFVAWAYAKAAMIVLEGADDKTPTPESRIRQMVPGFAVVQSPEVFRFLQALGVSRQEMPSPGDLMASEFVEVVAEWRRTDALLEFWTRFLVALAYIERLNQGYILTPPRNLTVGAIRGSGWFKDHVFDFGLTPEALNGPGLVTLYTFDRKVFQPVTDRLLGGYDRQATLLSQPPWVILGRASHALSADPAVRRRLRAPTK